MPSRTEVQFVTLRTDGIVPWPPTTPPDRYENIHDHQQVVQSFNLRLRLDAGGETMDLSVYGLPPGCSIAESTKVLLHRIQQLVGYESMRRDEEVIKAIQDFVKSCPPSTVGALCHPDDSVQQKLEGALVGCYDRLLNKELSSRMPNQGANSPYKYLFLGGKCWVQKSGSMDWNESPMSLTMENIAQFLLYEIQTAAAFGPFEYANIPDVLSEVLRGFINKAPETAHRFRTIVETTYGHDLRALLLLIAEHFGILVLTAPTSVFQKNLHDFKNEANGLLMSMERTNTETTMAKLDYLVERLVTFLALHYCALLQDAIDCRFQAIVHAHEMAAPTPNLPSPGFLAKYRPMDHDWFWKHMHEAKKAEQRVLRRGWSTSSRWCTPTARQVVVEALMPNGAAQPVLHTSRFGGWNGALTPAEHNVPGHQGHPTASPLSNPHHPSLTFGSTNASGSPTLPEIVGQVAHPTMAAINPAPGTTPPQIATFAEAPKPNDSNDPNEPFLFKPFDDTAFISYEEHNE